MREKAQVLDEFWLKILAILFMTLDHVGLFLCFYFPDEAAPQNAVGTILRYVGRIAFPLFAFMLAEGMRHSKKPLRYISRLGLVWAICEIAEIVFLYGFSKDYGPEPLTDLIFSAVALYLLGLKGWRKLFALIPAAFVGLSFGVGMYEAIVPVNVVWLPGIFRAGYGLYGLVSVLGFYYALPIAKAIARKSFVPLGDEAEAQFAAFQDTKQMRSLINLVGITFFVASTVLFWGLNYWVTGGDVGDIDVYNDMSIGSYGLFAILFLYGYNGKRGYDGKAFRIATYSYFPVHLSIIFIIFRLIFHY